MVNPSTLAAAGGGVIATVVETVAEVTGAAAGRAAARAAPAPASRSIPLLLDPDFIRTIGRVFTTLRGRRSATSVAGWAPAPSAAKKTSSSKASATSFLSDPKLSIEEKLMRLLAYLSDKWEKQMQAKLDQINADEANTADGGTSGSSTKKSGGGLLGGVLGGVGDVLGGILGSAGGDGGGIGAMLGKVFDVLQIPGVTSILGKVGGPVLAAAASALGFPAAAPAILQAAPALFEAAGGVASSAGGSASGGSSGSSATSGKSQGKMSDSQRQLLIMEIQRIYERQKEMFNLVSNILKSGHDTRMGVINNVRG
jgi:hypothetical protein